MSDELRALCAAERDYGLIVVDGKISGVFRSLDEAKESGITGPTLKRLEEIFQRHPGCSIVVAQDWKDLHGWTTTYFRHGIEVRT